MVDFSFSSLLKAICLQKFCQKPENKDNVLILYIFHGRKKL